MRYFYSQRIDTGIEFFLEDVDLSEVISWLKEIGLTEQGEPWPKGPSQNEIICHPQTFIYTGEKLLVVLADDLDATAFLLRFGGDA